MIKRFTGIKPVSRNTSRTYLKAYVRFKKFLADNSLPERFPPKRKIVLTWMHQMASRGLSASTLVVSLQAVAHASAERKKPIPADDMLFLRNSILQYQRDIAENNAAPRPSMGPPMLAEETGKVINMMDEACPKRAFMGPPDEPGLHYKNEGERIKALRNMRDTTVIAMLWSGAFRASEIVGIQAKDVSVSKDRKRARVLLRKSKGDQLGAGSVVWIEDYEHILDCAGAPSRLGDWMHLRERLFETPNPRGWNKDYLFGSASQGWLREMIAGWRRHYLKNGGTKEFTSHSFRIGFCTEMASRNAPIAKLQKHMRHKKTDTTMGYVQMTEDEASAGLLATTWGLAQ